MKFAAILAITGGLLAAKSVQVFDAPLRFEPNHGQAPPAARFVAKSKGFTLFAETEGLRFQSSSGDSLRMRFHGGQVPSAITGSDRQASLSHYFIGKDPKNWRTNVENFASVEYRDLYPGVHLKLHQRPKAEMEYDFIVDPGASAAAIQLEFEGAKKVSIAPNGDLLLHTASGVLRQKRPVLYQGKQQIAGNFIRKGKNRVAFSVGQYNKAKPLVIDPVLIFSTYLAGNQDDQLNGMAVDPQGNIYVTGSTKSTNFPRRNGFVNSTDTRGNFDAYVVKFNAAGTGVVFASFFGGNRDDIAQAVGVDSAGNVYVAGTTNSPDMPVSAGAYQTKNAGGFLEGDEGTLKGDVFLFKLRPDGSAIDWGTYFGGSLAESLSKMIIDRDGSPVLFGNTGGANFPVTPNAIQPAANGRGDAFITKFSAKGNAILYSTFWGGSGPDDAGAIYQDAQGSFYITGTTTSPNYPVTANAPQKALNGSNNSDIYVTKFTSNFSIVYSTLWGSPLNDAGTSIYADASGVVIVGGTTNSLQFPLIKPLQPFGGGGPTDGVFFTLNDDGSKVNFSSYFGGSRIEYNLQVGALPDGTWVICETTESADFPATSDSFIPFNRGSRDMLLIKVSNDGQNLLYSSYFGGETSDFLNAMYVDPFGNTFLAGTTDSHFFPTTRGAFQDVWQGGSDGFVVKIAESLPAFRVADLPAIQTKSGGASVSVPLALSSTGTAIPFTITPTSTGNWLSVSPLAGTTPATIQVTVDPIGLGTGNYIGRLVFATAGAQTATTSFSVQVSVASNLVVTGPQISAAGIVNGASFKTGAISPGEILTFFGIGIGPDTLAGAQLNSAGTVSNNVAGTRVLFDGVAAPLIYTSDGQTAAIAPYFLSNRATTKVQVEYFGTRSAEVVMQTVPSSPAIFTVSAGTGQAAALNESGSFNSSAIPAKKGSVVVLYLTGEGETDPGGIDGKLANSVYPKPVLPVVARISGMEAEVLYAGAAPGLVAGAMQVNLKIPANAPSGALPVFLTVGTATSQTGVTIAVE